MPAKKTMKKTAKKTAKPVAKTIEKKCDCAEKCDCKDCKCGGHNQLPIYLLVGMLVATLTVLIVSVSFNLSVRDIFRPVTYIYNGKFDADVKNEKKDESGITIISAGAAIDMAKNKSGFIIVGEENDISSDAFARRVASLVEGEDGIYRYNTKVEEDADDIRAKNILGVYDEVPTIVYVKNGVVYDRIDDVKDIDDLTVFLSKYLPTKED